MSERRATWMVGGLLVPLLVLPLLPGGCHGKAAKPAGVMPPDQPSSRPVGTPTAAATTHASVVTYDGSQWGILLDYCSAWTPKPNKDYVLYLLPGGAAAADDQRRSLSLDIPDLPPHIPGMIPLRFVKSGYVDDLRKQHPDMQTREQSPPPQVPHASAALVTSTWPGPAAAVQMTEIALILVHGDHVYILRANYDAPGEAETRRAFEAMRASVRWK
jgi:hypothetical protein